MVQTCSAKSTAREQASSVSLRNQAISEEIKNTHFDSKLKKTATENRTSTYPCINNNAAVHNCDFHSETGCNNPNCEIGIDIRDSSFFLVRLEIVVVLA